MERIAAVLQKFFMREQGAGISAIGRFPRLADLAERRVDVLAEDRSETLMTPGGAESRELQKLLMDSFSNASEATTTYSLDLPAESNVITGFQ